MTLTHHTLVHHRKDVVEDDDDDDGSVTSFFPLPPFLQITKFQFSKKKEIEPEKEWITYVDEDRVQFLVEGVQRFAAQLLHHRADRFLRGGLVQEALLDQVGERFERTAADLVKRKNGEEKGS